MAVYVIFLGLIASSFFGPTSQLNHSFKNRLAVNLHRFTTGPLSITIYSKNVLKPLSFLNLRPVSHRLSRFKLVVSLFSNPLPSMPESVRFKRLPLIGSAKVSAKRRQSKPVWK